MRALLIGTTAVLLLTAYTLALFTLLAPLILLKLLTRPLPPIKPLDAAVVALADTWNRLNAAGLQWASSTRWQVHLPPDLSQHAWYLVVCNHQSWVDILVLQHCLQGRAPFLKFFIKRQLIWVPLVGLVEGTRFTPAKHEAQGSPYRHLLKPKAGGMMTALDVLGDRLDAVLDVTIFYPGRVPSFVDVLCGRVPEVRVHIDRQPVPATGDGQPLAVTEVQAWLAELWQAKDARFKQLGS